MKTLLFFLAVILVNTSFGQTTTIDGKVLDLDRKAVSEAAIIDQNGKLLGTTNESGVFEDLKVQIGERIGVDKVGFELKWVAIVDGKTNYRVVLDVKVQEFESVVITRRNSEEALDLKNVNIIHYQPLDGAILTLKKEKRTYYLGMDSLRKAGTSYALDIDKPELLFFDCFQNAYVLSADSAYQFVMLDSGMVMLPAIPMTLFNQYIRPCVAKFDNRLVMEEFRSYNKEYDLVLYDDKEPKTIYHKRDQLGYQAAYEASVAVGKTADPNNGDTLTDPVYLRRQERRDVYGRHDTGPDFQRRIAEQDAVVMAENRRAELTFNSPDSTNSIAPVYNSRPFGSNDAWGNGGDWAQGMAAYILFTQPLDVRTFQVGSFVAVVDFDSNAVNIIDHYGFPIKESDFEVPSDVKNVLQDKATGALYLYTRDRGNHKIYGLDPFTGRTSYLKNFGGMPNAEQAIIYDGFLYYKMLDRDFYGINRVRLPSSIFFAEED